MALYHKLEEDDASPEEALISNQSDGHNRDNRICKTLASWVSRYRPLLTLTLGIILGASVVLLSMGLAKTNPFRAANHKTSDELCVPKSERYNCGNSTEQALALGCYFDLLSVSFVPWQCADRELEAQFLAEGPWKYWADRHQTQELKQDELWKRPTMPNDSFHVTMHWHRLHCLYQWRKMHRALESGRRMDTSYKFYGHTLHCGAVFSDTRPGNATGGTVSIHFDSC